MFVQGICSEFSGDTLSSCTVRISVPTTWKLFMCQLFKGHNTNSWLITVGAVVVWPLWMQSESYPVFLAVSGYKNPNRTVIPVFCSWSHSMLLIWILRLIFSSILNEKKSQKLCYFSCNGLRHGKKKDEKKTEVTFIKLT